MGYQWRVTASARPELGASGTEKDMVVDFATLQAHRARGATRSTTFL